jgi:hypothetical protein
MVFAWRRSRAAVTDRRQPPRKLARRANSGHDNLKVPAGHFHESSTLEEECLRRVVQITLAAPLYFDGGEFDARPACQGPACFLVVIIH